MSSFEIPAAILQRYIGIIDAEIVRCGPENVERIEVMQTPAPGYLDQRFLVLKNGERIGFDMKWATGKTAIEFNYHLVWADSH